MEFKSFYEVLGVEQSASSQEIKAAYRQLTKKHHPDLHGNVHKAEENFKRIVAAYETLSDSYTRARYDYHLFWVDDSDSELSKRAVACKGWRWLPGMRANGLRVIALDTNGLPLGMKNPRPNLKDPVTGISLLLLVREAWHEPLLTTAWDEQGWYVLTPYGTPLFGEERWATEVETLVYALEIADDHLDDIDENEDPLALSWGKMS